MTPTEAVLLDAISLPELLKLRLPFLRIDTLRRLADVVQALIQAQSTRHGSLLPHLPGECSLEAKRRRLERCFQDEQVDATVFLRLLIPLLPPGKLVLALDRSNWQRGQANLNLLVLGVVFAGLTLPLVWVALPHGGSSDTAARQRLVARLLHWLPASRWRVLVADREFLGADWFTFLRQRRIKRCIRVRLDTQVDGERLSRAFAYVQPGQVVGLLERANLYGQMMQLVVSRDAHGELIAFASDLPIAQTQAAYRQRFSVECSFSALKSRGFGLEDTAMTTADRLERMFGLLTLALICCVHVGLWRHARWPIRLKKHGRPAISLWRYGWERLAHDLRWALPACHTYFALLLLPFGSPACPSP